MNLQVVPETDIVGTRATRPLVAAYALLFVAGLENGSVEVVDLKTGK
jgi:hypothetical protein